MFEYERKFERKKEKKGFLRICHVRERERRTFFYFQ